MHSTRACRSLLGLNCAFTNLICNLSPVLDGFPEVPNRRHISGEGYGQLSRLFPRKRTHFFAFRHPAFVVSSPPLLAFWLPKEGNTLSASATSSLPSVIAAIVELRQLG